MSRELRALLVVCLVFAVGAVGYRFLFAAGLGDRFRIVTVSGDVRHVHSAGSTDPALAGTMLAAGDRIVSGDGGRAVLGLGDDTRVSVDASSGVTVLGITDEGVRLELEEGRVRATVRPGSGRVGLVSQGREVTAEDADFTAVRDEDGNFAVSATRGQVGVTGVEGATELREGEELLAPSGGGSPLRAPASDTLLLQVAFPSVGRTREDEVIVEGATQPGATVTVRGGTRAVTTRAGKDGRFSLRVPIAEGKNLLAAEATSLLGRSAEVARAEVVRDTTVPHVGVTLEF